MVVGKDSLHALPLLVPLAVIWSLSLDKFLQRRRSAAGQI